MRRRLRELQDRMLALGTVHERFARPEIVAAAAGSAPQGSAAPAAAPESLAVPRPAPDAIPFAAPMPIEPTAAQTPPEVRAILAPPKREAETYAPLLSTLASRHPEGFTVSQLRDLMDFTEPQRAHTYDAAWTLANSLLRTQTLELAGTRAGPSGLPIRVYKIPLSVPGSEVP